MAPASRERSPARSRGRAGAALCRLVDLVSHRSGLALGIMNEAAITLPQVLLLSHVERRGSASPSALAEALHASLPSVSQMIDRLVQQGLLDRTEDPLDRRRKSLATTAGASAFLRKLGAARSMEYELGLASVPAELLAQMATLLERVVSELERPTKVTPRRDTRSPRRTR
jgi:DNA-binding MarR family transcriptional regulator